MLNKDDIRRGDYVVVRDVIKMGLSFHPDINKSMKAMRLWKTKTFGIGEFMPIYSKEYVKVLKGPHDIDGVNVVEVEDGDGTVGYVYWCEFRASCDKVKE